MSMQACPKCGTIVSASQPSCPNCKHNLQHMQQKTQKKQRSFLAALLGLLGIRRNPQTGKLGCAVVPAAISVAAIVLAILVVVGPVLKLVPPFASSQTTPRTSTVQILGDWNVTYGAPATVTISGGPGSSAGGVYTVTAKSPVRVENATCDLPPGTIIATFSRSGASYSGQHRLWYTDCSFAMWTPITLTLNGNKLTAVFNGLPDTVFTKTGI